MDGAETNEWQAYSGRGGFMDDVGPLLRKTLPNGEVRYALQLEDRHLNGMGVVHGGVIMTFLDHVVGSAGGRTHESPNQATVHLTVSFVAPAMPGGLLEADCEVVRTTRSMIFLRGVARIGDTVVATADGVWKILRPRG